MAATLVFAATIQAQVPPAPPEKLLVPLMVSEPTPGAFGSLWSTTFAVRNAGRGSVGISDTISGLCTDVITCKTLLAPGAFAELSYRVPNPNAGTFVYVNGDLQVRPGLGMTLKVRDLSRAAQTWGTTLPVVREKETYRASAQFVDVPVSSEFRSALRIYDYNSDPSVPAPQVRMRVYSLQTGATVAEQSATLTRDSGATSTPGFYMVDDLLARFPALVAHRRVHVEVTAESESVRFYALVSATNNETQHVTMVPPMTTPTIGPEPHLFDVVVAPNCSDPAPLGNVETRADPSRRVAAYGISLLPSFSGPSAVNRLALRHGITVQDNFGSSFFADLTPIQAAALRCETSVASVAFLTAPQPPP